MLNHSWMDTKEEVPMSLSDKERFEHRGLLCILENPKDFMYEYKYKDKNKMFKKHVHLVDLGESLNKDLLEGEGVQRLLTDAEGELYEAYIDELILRSIRSLRKPTTKKKKETVVENTEEEHEDEDIC